LKFGSDLSIRKMVFVYRVKDVCQPPVIG